ncbi:PAS-domain containing protein [Methylobacterium phyllosphaerae]
MTSGTVALREKAKRLDTVLDTMDQGLMMIDAAGVVQVCNARALALLDLPPALMRSRPTFEAVREYQIAQGEFGKASEALRRWVADRGVERGAHTYERERARTAPCWRSGPCRCPTEGRCGPSPTSPRASGPRRRCR